MSRIKLHHDSNVATHSGFPAFAKGYGGHGRPPLQRRGAFEIPSAGGVPERRGGFSRLSRSGMTMVELMMVVAIIGLLSVILVPISKKAFEYKENSEVAHKLRTAIQAFELYRAEEGGYPPDKNPGITPVGMDEFFGYFDIDWWAETTEVGGKFDWDNGYNFSYSISISAPTKSRSQLEDLDKMIDDGNLSTGNFRAIESQYHYILEE